MVALGDNPYQPPEASTGRRVDSRNTQSIARTVFFVGNCAVAVLFMIACIVAVAQSTSPYSFLGGILFFPVAAGAAITEWRVWHRRKHTLEKVLGGLCVGVSALTMFGVIANVAEALQSSRPNGFEWFVMMGIIVACYFGACGVWRIWFSKSIA